jgi:hypothetical protein
VTIRALKKSGDGCRRKYSEITERDTVKVTCSTLGATTAEYAYRFYARELDK